MRRLVCLCLVLILFSAGCAVREELAPAESPAQAEPISESQSPPEEEAGSEKSGLEKEGPASAQVISPGVTVKTYWSALEERPLPEPQGSRWYKEYQDKLTPRDDYGLLIPYVGLEKWDHQISSWCYGLMTRKGAVVVDPIYEYAYSPDYEDVDGRHTLPLLILGQARAGGRYGGQMLYSVAAADGSWYREFGPCEIIPWREGLLIFTEQGLTLMDTQGESYAFYTLAELGLTPRHYEYMFDGGMSTYGDYVDLPQEEDICFIFDIPAGRVVEMARDSWWEIMEAVWNADHWDIQVGEDETVLARDGRSYTLAYGDGRYAQVWDDLVLFPRSGAVYTLAGAEVLAGAENAEVTYMFDYLLGEAGSALLKRSIYDDEGKLQRTDYYQTDGSPIPLEVEGNTALFGGLLRVSRGNTFAYYDLDALECVFLTYLGNNGD